MQKALLITQIVLAAVLTGMILIQSKGTGFGRSFGGGASSFTRRGLESLVFKFTFIVSFVFITISILQLII